MADYTWPDSLPRSPQVGTLSVVSQDSILRGPADIGEGQIRSRASSSSDLLTFSLILTEQQTITLRNFFKTTLSSGVYRFNFLHPILHESKEFRFTNPPTISHMSGEVFKADISLIQRAE